MASLALRFRARLWPAVCRTSDQSLKPASLRLLVLEDRITPSIAEFLDPHPAPGNQFGATVLPLSTGNVVITSPFDDAGGTDAGAVYLFNGGTGALISTLKGSHANDNIGSFGVTALYNGTMSWTAPIGTTARL